MNCFATTEAEDAMQVESILISMMGNPYLAGLARDPEAYREMMESIPQIREASGVGRA